MILVSFGFSKFIRTSCDTGKHATVTVGEAISGLNAEYRKTLKTHGNNKTNREIKNSKQYCLIVSRCKQQGGAALCQLV